MCVCVCVHGERIRMASNPLVKKSSRCIYSKVFSSCHPVFCSCLHSITVKIEETKINHTNAEKLHMIKKCVLSARMQIFILHNNLSTVLCQLRTNQHTQLSLQCKHMVIFPVYYLFAQLSLILCLLTNIFEQLFCSRVFFQSQRYCLFQSSGLSQNFSASKLLFSFSLFFALFPTSWFTFRLLKHNFFYCV